MSAIFDGGRPKSAQDLEREESHEFQQFNDEGLGDRDDAPPRERDRDDDSDRGQDAAPRPRLRVGNPDEDEAEEIALRAEKRFTKTGKEFAGDMNDRDLQYGTFTEDDGEAPIGTKARDGERPEGERPEGEEGEEPAKPAVGDPTKFKLRVNHQDVELTAEELVAAAQKSLAGDDYLTQAKRALDEAREVARQIQQGTRPMETEQERIEAEAGLSDAQKDARRQFLEAITYGTEEEQARAIDEFETRIISTATETMRNQMEREAVYAFVEKDLRDQGDAIAESFPAIARSTPLADAVANRAARIAGERLARLVENLPPGHQAALAPHKITPTDLRRETNFVKIREIYTDFLAHGYGPHYGLTPLGRDVLHAADEVARELGIPARRSGAAPRAGQGQPPANQPGRDPRPESVQLSEARQQRKDGLTPQPKRASQAPTAGRGAPNARVSQRDFHNEYLAEQREERGIPIRRR